MGGLVTAPEMAALREIPEMGMTDEVTILTMVSSPGLEGDYDESYAASVTTKGWLWEAPASAKGDVVGGVEGVDTAYRLYLPVGTPIDNGDRVYIKGAVYQVLATNAESTFQPVLRVALRRAE